MSEPDFKTIFYDSQARLSDSIDQLRNLILKIENDMRIAEEMVINESEENK